jgi:hypothetical protein
LPASDTPGQQTTPLDRLIVEARVLAGEPHPCRILGHRWRHKGGKNCGCEWRDEDGGISTGSCSVPVYECEACGDCDYGDNAEAAETREVCHAE